MRAKTARLMGYERLRQFNLFDGLFIYTSIDGTVSVL